MGAYDPVGKVRSRGLAGGLSELRVELRLACNKYWPAEMYSDFERRCARFIDEERIVSEEKILRCWHLGDRECGSVEMKERFFYAVLYFLAAEREYEKQYDDTAGLLAMRSMKELGRLDGWRQCMAVINIAYNGRMKGGDAGSAIREDAYRELQRYMASGPVKKDGVWRFKEDVVRDFEQRLQVYMNEKYPLYSFKADNFIEKSLGRKGLVKDTFLLHKQSGKKKPD